MEAPIEIVAYDPAWPAMFAAERDAIREAIGPWLTGEIEHVGSTAVPGLAAKPVIDIMAPIAGLETSRPALERLAAIGYCYAPYRDDVEHWLCKPSPSHRTHHLHLVPGGSRLWMDRIRFRNTLRGILVLARQIANLHRQRDELIESLTRLKDNVHVISGAIDYPDPSIAWQIVEKYGVTKMFTAPTALRMFMRYGEKLPQAHDISSLRLICCAGVTRTPKPGAGPRPTSPATASGDMWSITGGRPSWAARPWAPLAPCLCVAERRAWHSPVGAPTLWTSTASRSRRVLTEGWY